MGSSAINELIFFSKSLSFPFSTASANSCIFRQLDVVGYSDLKAEFAAFPKSKTIFVGSNKELSSRISRNACCYVFPNKSNGIFVLEVVFFLRTNFEFLTSYF